MPRWAFMLIVVVVYQILLYVLFRSLQWLFGGRGGWLLALIVFIVGDGVLVACTMRLVANPYTVLGISMSLIWFWVLTAIVIGILYLILPKHGGWVLKALLPLGFIGLMGWGWFNAHSPVVKHFNVTLNKPTAPFRVAVASDLHLGDEIGNKMLAKLNALMAAAKPDVILLPGDIIDNDATPYLQEKMYQTLGQLHAKDGVYATLGNHEFYGGASRNADAIKASGVTLLRNQAVTIADKLVVIGRDDDMDSARPPLANIVKQVDSKLPVLVMDHRPTQIEAASQLPIDIQVSGHTHRGQIFPSNIITHFIYTLSYGYKEINGVHFFTTSGFGFWGPPFRLGSRSEIFVIDVKGKEA